MDLHLNRPAPAVRATYLLAALVALMGVDLLLLPFFLGVASLWIELSSGLALVLLVSAIARRDNGASISLQRLLKCSAISLAIMILGGEGHLLYANLDWQVRDAVLRDLIRFDWPFAYSGMGPLKILRAPVGMYLMPAIVGKALGVKAAGCFLLLQNSVLVGILLALGSLLFETASARRVAFIVLVLFSGMDALGTLLVRPGMLLPFDRHIEFWSGLEYSSTITLAFWVPQHAISGWIGGLLYMLWQRRIVPLSTFLGITPFCALWSPLGVMGTMPFALLAAVQSLLKREIAWQDIVIPAIGAILAVPSLLYLGADAGKVGAHFAGVDPSVYILFEIVEVVPILFYVTALGGAQSFGRAPLIILSVCLAIFPFIVVGESIDFMMRASIPSLLILTVITADRIALETPHTRWKMALIAILAIGAITPMREVYRAILFRAPPYPACDVEASWQVSFGRYGSNTYFARVTALPQAIRPTSVQMAPPTTGPCYSRPWGVRRWS